MSLAIASGRAPIEAGWSTTTSTDGSPPRVGGVTVDDIGPGVFRNVRIDDEAVEAGVKVVSDLGEDPLRQVSRVRVAMHESVELAVSGRVQVQEQGVAPAVAGDREKAGQ
ncbi:hypothetical protein AB0D62_36795 [Streptomyces massasporeus]